MSAYRDLYRAFPWREEQAPYGLFVAEYLLQKTMADRVVPVWTEVVRDWPDLQALSGADLDALQRALCSLGINKRASRLINAAGLLIASGFTDVPPDVDVLASLPGLGSYGVSALMSFAFDRPTLVVDVNAGRLYARFTGIRCQTLRQSLEVARTCGEAILTPRNHRRVNYGMLDLCAQVCTARQPKCEVCPLRSGCDYAAIVRGLTRASTRQRRVR